MKKLRGRTDRQQMSRVQIRTEHLHVVQVQNLLSSLQLILHDGAENETRCRQLDRCEKYHRKIAHLHS